MTNYIGKITSHDLEMATKIANRRGETPAKVLNDFNDFLAQVYEQEEEECDQYHTRHAESRLENVSGRQQNTQYQKERLGGKMLNLSYTVEKEGNLVSVVDRLMLNEYQINNLMDTLVSHGYTVESMSVTPATL